MESKPLPLIFFGHRASPGRSSNLDPGGFAEPCTNDARAVASFGGTSPGAEGLTTFVVALVLSDAQRFEMLEPIAPCQDELLIDVFDSIRCAEKAIGDGSDI